MPILSIAECEQLAARALEASGAAAGQSLSTARALVAAEADGQSGHGLGRVPSYASQVRAGKVDGRALPSFRRLAAAAVRIDAAHGFAYPALDVAVETLPGLAREHGLAIATIHRSHHIGAAGYTAERLARQGCVGFVCSNTPPAMAFAGCARPMMGTNPIAFAAPLPERAPLVIDMALSQVARSRIVAAQSTGKGIPTGWATDSNGRPTTDPSAALAGALTPIGGAKGAALALVIEILCGALAGGHFGWEASSFLDDRGAAPAVGQVLLAFDAHSLSAGGFAARMSVLLATLGEQDGARIPGDRRLASRARAASGGIDIAPALHDRLTTLARAERTLQ
ncbi:MAG TPA: Ldh family oxidoreductase [Steroidobacteraceae bacterium]|jgi:(2R)-3-sulfolactate dehydrogenase (NADP+)|nr:Ldh family oxidoreductase [Steroidobacteraceae bacterium]